MASRAPIERKPTDAKREGRPGADIPLRETDGQTVRFSNDLARLAHELRTPLAAIAVLAEMMRDERLGPLGTPRYKGYAADIHSSAAHANAVLASWLEPAQAGTGQGGALDFVELDLSDLLRSALSAIAPLAERAGVSLQFDAPAALPHVIADRRSIRQIVTNLVSNALKFTPPGGLIAVAVTYRPGGPVVVEVVDNGDGMSPAELARARSAGQSSEALRRRSGGSGIGLPLVRALATGCGAHFEIDSKANRGTRVRVAFPHDRVVPV